ncbi:MAG: hypothetical protein ACRD1W_01245 [Vicinamibacterales bacterium]
MRNTLVSAAVGAAVAVAVVGAVSVLSRANDKKMVYATITLVGLSTDSCRIVTIPQTLEMKRNETVEWSIVDLCGLTDANDAVIAFTGSNGDPLQEGCDKSEKKKIRCGLKNNQAYGYYKYSVTVGALTEDPELEIVQ